MPNHGRKLALISANRILTVVVNSASVAMVDTVKRIRPGLHRDELRKPAIDDGHHDLDLGQRKFLLGTERTEGEAEGKRARQHRSDRIDAGNNAIARPVGTRHARGFEMR